MDALLTAVVHAHHDLMDPAALALFHGEELRLDVVRRNDEGAKPAVQRRQQNLLNERYDLADRPMQGVKMSGGRKGIQEGVRVKLRSGTTWDSLANMSPDDIKAKGLFPAGFLPLPHVKHLTGGQVFPGAGVREPRVTRLARGA